MVVNNYTTFRAVFADASTIATDGHEVWPFELLRASGFDDGFSGIDQPITAFPITVSVNGLANGSEAHDIYVSQQTDDSTKQYLSVALASGKSGTWNISLTSKAVSDLGLESTIDTINEDQLRRIAKNVYIYVRRHSDGAIQWVDLTKATFDIA